MHTVVGTSVSADDCMRSAAAASSVGTRHECFAWSASAGGCYVCSECSVIALVGHDVWRWFDTYSPPPPTHLPHLLLPNLDLYASVWKVRGAKL